jgi:hypothetical protein
MWLAVAFGCLVALSGFGAALDHAGPLFDRHPLTLFPGEETQAAGPLFYDRRQGEEHTWAVPPLLSYTQDPGVPLAEFDFLYPLLTYDRYGSQFRWQFFQVLSYSGGPSPGEKERNRFTLFPIYFQQRSSRPEENYTAVAPFYGHLKDRLFRNEIFFVMFPLYSKTRKGQVITENYLFPFFDRSYGGGVRGWQFWPIIGHDHKEITTRTNGFNEVETVPGYDSRFVLWPLYYNQHAGLGSDNPDWQQGVLPLYALERSPQRDSTTVLWPFFSYVNDRGKKYHEWDAPWPLVEFAGGEGKHTTRVWPFFSHARSPELEDNFYLWPVYKYDAIHAPPLERSRRRIAFFVYSDIREQNTETGQSKRRTDLWPLLTRRREFNGDTRLQLLAPLEVWTLGSHKIERDWSPVWSVWVSKHQAQTGAASQSLLWNLYRRDTAPGSRRVSALFGLFQYHADPTAKRLRLFYVPLWERKQSARGLAQSMTLREAAKPTCVRNASLRLDAE